MIEAIETAQSDYLNSRSEKQKKELGQYFTGSVVADYMASMIKPINTTTVRILDAGAGAGILTIAAALKCMNLGNKKVHAVLYEIDNEALPYLKVNMEKLSRRFKELGGKFTFDIKNEDFVLSRPDRAKEKFHLSSINPPYFKYSSTSSPYSKATADIYKGNPNIYASFMAVVAACMTTNGQMIAIVPRSFTNGLYFKGFRKYMNKTMSLEIVHIFRSRGKVFKDFSVLQENIICKYVKKCQRPTVEVHTSTCYEDLGRSEKNRYSSNLIIDKSNEHEIIRIPESSENARIMEIVEQWPASFQDNGYFISTGPVVEHRTKEYIAGPELKPRNIPLLRMHNVKAFATEWTGEHRKDACFKLIGEYEKHTTKNQPYVLLKRFSSKDEKRRLVASIHNPKTVKGNLIALENHLNYIGRVDGRLDLLEAYGLAVLFNSTFMDRYFRCISGNTQVNATEIRLLKLPAREVIQQLGVMFQERPSVEQQYLDSIVNFYIEA